VPLASVAILLPKSRWAAKRSKRELNSAAAGGGEVLGPAAAVANHREKHGGL